MRQRGPLDQTTLHELVSDLLVAVLLSSGAFVALQRRSLQVDTVALLGLAFAPDVVVYGFYWDDITPSRPALFGGFRVK